MGYKAGRIGPMNTGGVRPFQIQRPARLDAGGSFFFMERLKEESSNQRESLSAYKGFDDR
jgi:hypothetical protein